MAQGRVEAANTSVKESRQTFSKIWKRFGIDTDRVAVFA